MNMIAEIYIEFNKQDFKDNFTSIENSLGNILSTYSFNNQQDDFYCVTSEVMYFSNAEINIEKLKISIANSGIPFKKIYSIEIDN